MVLHRPPHLSPVLLDLHQRRRCLRIRSKTTSWVGMESTSFSCLQPLQPCRWVLCCQTTWKKAADWIEGIGGEQRAKAKKTPVTTRVTLHIGVVLLDLYAGGIWLWTIVRLIMTNLYVYFASRVYLRVRSINAITFLRHAPCLVGFFLLTLRVMILWLQLAWFGDNSLVAFPFHDIHKDILRRRAWRRWAAW